MSPAFDRYYVPGTQLCNLDDPYLELGRSSSPEWISLKGTFPQWIEAKIQLIPVFYSQDFGPINAEIAGKSSLIQVPDFSQRVCAMNFEKLEETAFQMQGKDVVYRAFGDCATNGEKKKITLSPHDRLVFSGLERNWPNIAGTMTYTAGATFLEQLFFIKQGYMHLVIQGGQGMLYPAAEEERDPAREHEISVLRWLADGNLTLIIDSDDLQGVYRSSIKSNTTLEEEVFVGQEASKDMLNIRFLWKGLKQNPAIDFLQEKHNSPEEAKENFPIDQ